MLAIAAPSFDQPSETFIRDHVRHIAPGETVLVSAKAGEGECLGCPALTDVAVWRPVSGPGARLVNSLTFRWRHRVNLTLGRREEDRLAAFLREHRVEALLVEFLNTAVPLAPAARKAGVPLYAHAHGWEVTILGEEPQWRRRYRRLFENVAGLIAASEFMSLRLEALGAPKELIFGSPMGIDVEKFRPILNRPNRAQSILCISRLVPQKGVPQTVEAFRIVKQRYPRATLTVIGDGPCRQEVEEAVNRNGLTDSVMLLGAVPHETVQDHLSRASMLAQHCIALSRGGVESFGIAPLEAMASGVPVIATRHGALPENISDGDTGLLIEEHDTDGMAEAICALLADPARARAMGEAGRRRVLANYTHAHTRDRLRAIMGLPPVAPAEAPAGTGVA